MKDLKLNNSSDSKISGLAKLFYKFEDFLIIALWACVIPGIHYGTKLCLNIITLMNS